MEYSTPQIVAASSIGSDKQPLEAIFRPALVLMTGRFAGFIATFAIPIVLARVFSQDDFGSYKQIFLIYTTLYVIAQMGMAESLYYFLPFDSRRSGRYLCNSMLALGALGALSLGALWLWREPVANLLSNPALASQIPLVGLFLMFMLLAVVLEIAMTVRRQHMAASFAYAVSDLARAVLFLAPLLILADLRTLLLGAIGFAAIRFAATLVYVQREFRGGLRMDGPSLRTQLAYAVPLGVAALIETLQVNFHMYAVSHYFDSATFAIYAVGCLQIPLSDFLMTSTSNVMMVNMREKILGGDHASAVSIWLDSVRKLSLIFFPLVAVLLISAQPLIVFLFTPTYQESVPIFMVWTLSMLLAALLTDGALRVFGQTRFLIIQNLLRLGVTIALIQWFISSYELMGAVIVTLLAMAIAKIAALGRIKVVMRVGMGQLLPWKSLGITMVITAAAAAPAVLVRSVLAAMSVHIAVLLLATGIVYSLAYYVLLQWFGPMDAEEKRMLSGSLRVPFIRLRNAWKFCASQMARQ